MLVVLRQGQLLNHVMKVRTESTYLILLKPTSREKILEDLKSSEQKGCHWREHLDTNVAELSDWNAGRLIAVNLRRRETPLFLEIGRAHV